MSTTKHPMLSSAHAIFCGLQESLHESLCTLLNNTLAHLKLGLTRAHLKLSDYYGKFDDSPYYTWSSHEWFPFICCVLAKEFSCSTGSVNWLWWSAHWLWGWSFNAEGSWMLMWRPLRPLPNLLCTKSAVNNQSISSRIICHLQLTSEGWLHGTIQEIGTLTCWWGWRVFQTTAGEPMSTYTKRSGWLCNCISPFHNIFFLYTTFALMCFFNSTSSAVGVHTYWMITRVFWSWLFDLFGYFC